MLRVVGSGRGQEGAVVDQEGTPSHPRISLVTPSRNQAGFLAGLLENLQDQKYPNLQHLVVDACSTDGTAELVGTTSGRTRWIVEDDAGQAVAINKGLAGADGQILGWLNCDDRLTPGALHYVADYFSTHPEADFLYGDALAVSGAGRRFGLRAHVGPCDLHALTHRGDFIVQPAAFWRASLMPRLGYLDESLTYAFDYEFWMRAARTVRLDYRPVCLAVERLHRGAVTARGHLDRIDELERVARRHGGPGVPHLFQAEATALSVQACLGAIARGRRGAAAGILARMRAWRPDPIRLAVFLPVVLLLGTTALADLRLVANRLRCWRRPAYPPPVAAPRAVREGTPARVHLALAHPRPASPGYLAPASRRQGRPVPGR